MLSGVDVYQQVHMVLFPAEFDQPAAPALEDTGKYLLCIRKDIWRQDLPPVKEKESTRPGTGRSNARGEGDKTY